MGNKYTRKGKRKPRNGKANGKALVLAPTRAEAEGLRLDLGCGQSPRERFEGVDLNAPTAKHKVDLFKFPWPWADNSVGEIFTSHFVEHLPAREVEARDLVVDRPGGADMRYVGKDFFFAFFDECYRIMKDGAFIEVIVPALKTDRAFQDPTHRRFITVATFAYLAKQWRQEQRLDHYRAECNFIANVNFSFPVDLQTRAPEVQQRMFNESWNATFDIVAKLRATKTELPVQPARLDYAVTQM